MADQRQLLNVPISQPGCRADGNRTLLNPVPGRLAQTPSVTRQKAGGLRRDDDTRRDRPPKR